jgi:hypothetical protein
VPVQSIAALRCDIEKQLAICVHSLCAVRPRRPKLDLYTLSHFTFIVAPCTVVGHHVQVTARSHRDERDRMYVVSSQTSDVYVYAEDFNIFSQKEKMPAH